MVFFLVGPRFVGSFSLLVLDLLALDLLALGLLTPSLVGPYLIICKRVIMA